MKTGIIIVFHNYENELHPKVLVNQIQKIVHVPLCLVNNDSKDETYDILKDVRDLCQNVSVVNIKKFKSDMSAVRAGARFLLSQYQLKHLGYINTNLISSNLGFVPFLEVFAAYHNDIISMGISNQKPSKQKTTQPLFSVVDEVQKLKASFQKENILQ
ncbi:family 2 glycosyl transferase [Psychroserpens sp. XS_ASV72]|uniref:family 2 glycosyl transferase n=1 Tax=Psychroserpens sp. XS_ASV72 TaxID=3241293 RepID=UPI003510D81A